MIGNLVQGTDFQGCLSYVLGKPGADRVGGNTTGLTVVELAAEFDRLRLRRPTLSHAVYHISLSLAPGEFLNDDAWDDLTCKYLDRMGITGTNYVSVRHTDTDRNHIHIVSSRIRFDGSAIDDSWDYSRSQAILRDLESEYNLTPVASSQSADRHAPTRRQIEKFKQIGQETVKAKLQRLIDRSIPNTSTLNDLRDCLEIEGVTTRFTYSKNGLPKGISFGCEGVALAGHHLGRAYSLPALRQRLPASDVVEESPTTLTQAAQIQTAIQSITATSLSEFIEQLHRQGVEVHIKSKTSGRQRQMSSLSYSIGSVSFLDSDLGDEFTFRRLRQRQFSEDDLLLPSLRLITEQLVAEPEAQAVSLPHRLYDFLAESIRKDGQSRSPLELDLAIARYIVQNGSREDVKALIYSPEVQRLKQIEQEQAERYLQSILQTALESPTLDEEHSI